MRSTFQYILKKLLAMIPMLFLITFLIYLGLYLTPGDPISHMVPPDQLANISPDKMEALRELYGLNDPFIIQYVKWLSQLLQGNFGYSITNGVAIKDLLLQLLPTTLELSLAALFISSVLGVSLTAGVMRYARSSMLDTMNKDYIKTARAKGLPEWRVKLG